jgi:hypothetical protein
MHTSTASKVDAVTQNAEVQPISNPTPQDDLIGGLNVPKSALTHAIKGNGKRTFTSLDESPEIPTTGTVQATPAKKVRSFGMPVYNARSNDLTDQH